MDPISEFTGELNNPPELEANENELLETVKLVQSRLCDLDVKYVSAELKKFAI